jgi:acetyl esterase/lipase
VVACECRRVRGWNPDRIAIGGFSAVGHLASLAALTAGDVQPEGDVGDHLGVSSAVSAVVTYCLSSDFLLSGAQRARDSAPHASVDRCAARARPDRRRPRGCAIGQPASLLHAGAPPHLILDGDRDAVFNHEQSGVLHEALSVVGAQSMYVLIAALATRSRSSLPAQSRRRSSAS